MSELNRKQLLHKMKSPLTSLMGYAEMVRIKLKKSPEDPKIDEWLDKVKEDALIIKEMIEKVEALEEPSES